MSDKDDLWLVLITVDTATRSQNMIRFKDNKITIEGDRKLVQVYE